MDRRTVINLIKELRAKRIPYLRIAEILNAENHRTPSGLPWSQSAVCSYALRNGVKRVNKKSRKRIKKTVKTAVAAPTPTPTPTIPVKLDELKEFRVWCLQTLNAPTLTAEQKCAIIRVSITGKFEGGDSGATLTIR